MFLRSITASAVATVVAALILGAVPAAVAGSSGPRVTVRIEGAKRTLLPKTTVRAPAAGWITKDGAPSRRCPADSAAGALNVATHGAWSGRWYRKYHDYLITKILGHSESGTKAYWEIFVNNVAADTGACEIKLHTGERLLFAVSTGTEYPLVIKAPRTATAGRSLKVTVDYVNAKGAAVALGGATVRTSRGAVVRTNGRGIAALRPKHDGKLTLRAHKQGYIRAAARTVKVRS